MSLNDHLAAVRDAADDVRQARRQLVDAMSDAIAGGVPAENIALAAMRAEIPYALMADLAGDERAPAEWPRKAS